MYIYTLILFTHLNNIYYIGIRYINAVYKRGHDDDTSRLAVEMVFFAVREILITASPSRQARQLQQLLSRSDPRRRIYNVLCAPTII